LSGKGRCDEMTRYIAFFASMNVGGNRLTMADLRDVLEREDFEDVESVVASGNVFFSHESRPSDGLADKLAYVVEDAFSFPTFAAVRNREELHAAIHDNPFYGDGDPGLVHTVFLDGQPAPEKFERLLEAYEGRGAERLALGDRALYVDYVDGVGNSKLTNAFIERRLGCRGTARNMRSLNRILEKIEAS